MARTVYTLQDLQGRFVGAFDGKQVELYEDEGDAEEFRTQAEADAFADELFNAGIDDFTVVKSVYPMQRDWIANLMEGDSK